MEIRFAIFDLLHSCSVEIRSAIFSLLHCRYMEIRLIVFDLFHSCSVEIRSAIFSDIPDVRLLVQPILPTDNLKMSSLFRPLSQVFRAL
ncbi:Dynein heavy chain [Gossypium australe]|uniref:Dynein heavy chain n=1 Tax=Gossypium australe TaxID=47621 RepID=A0A5B6VCV3_9ROSI|nr:Dynein heavy chain [Gossypium australe]